MAITDSTDSLERVRNAGTMERYHISLSELGLDTCVVAPATYSSTSAAVLDYATAVRALRHVVHAHPALCVQFAGSHDQEPYFVRLPQIDLNDVLHYSTDVTTPVEAVVSAELQRPFLRSTTKPLWRVTVRADNVVVFAWHHSIADGGCAHSFHAAFLSALNTKSEGLQSDDSTVIVVPHNLTIAPPLEDRTDISVSFKTTVGTIYDASAPLSLRSHRKAWTANPIPKELSLKIETRIRKIHPHDARNLIALCREKKCTLTAFIHTLATLVLSHHVTALEDEKKYKTFSTVVPISLRRFTGTSPLDICDHVTIYHSYPKIVRDIFVYPPTRATFPWQTAAKYTTTLHANLEKAREVIGTIGFIYKLGGASDYFTEQLGKKRDYTLVLSNIGAMPKLSDLGEKQRDDGVLWQVDDIGFGQSDNVLGSAIKINMTGSPSGAVSAIYNWGELNINSQLVEAFIEDIHNGISKILTM